MGKTHWGQPPALSLSLCPSAGADLITAGREGAGPQGGRRADLQGGESGKGGGRALDLPDSVLPWGKGGYVLLQGLSILSPRSRAQDFLNEKCRDTLASKPLVLQAMHLPGPCDSLSQKGEEACSPLSRFKRWLSCWSFFQTGVPFN